MSGHREKVSPSCNQCGESNPEEFYPYLRTKCKACHYAYQKSYRQRSAGKMVTKDKKYALRKRYGISVGQYESILESQSNRCAVCGDSASNQRHGSLHIDHDHKTGTVRGALCNGCNRAAGFLNDDPDKAAALAEYLYAGMGLNLMKSAIERSGDGDLTDTLRQMVIDERERRESWAKAKPGFDL